jgi:lipooligosaccharide transport system permease protein
VSSLTLALRPLEFFLAQYRQSWRGSAVSTVVTPVVYLLALGVGLGVFVDRSTNLPDGVSYLEFVAPGLMAATAMQIASFEATWPVLGAIKWHRQYHAMLATPLRSLDVMLGHQAYFLFRLLLTSTVYFVVIAAFGTVSSPLGVLAIPVSVLVGLAFTAPLAAWAAHTENEVSFLAIFRFLILPMFLISGAFFPVSTLPRVLEVLVWLTPLWHGVTLCRDLTLGRIEPWADVVHLAYVSAWVAAGLVAARITYARRLVV